MQKMPYALDQVDPDLCSRNFGAQSELTGGFKSLFSNIGHNGGSMIMICVGAVAVCPLGYHEWISWRTRFFLEDRRRPGAKETGPALPTTGWNIQAVLCADGTITKARIPLSENPINASGGIVGGAESF